MFAVALLMGMLLMSEIGVRLGARSHARDQAATEGTGSVEAALFALLGLLVAFTFSGAMNRFEVRRHLIVEEANAVGTAWLRLAMLPEVAQPAIRDQLRRYVDARLLAYQLIADDEASASAFGRADDLQREIWQGAVGAVKSAEAVPGTPQLLLAALNEMFDVVTKRTMALQTHPPEIIYWMLCVLAFATALFAGYGLGTCGSRKRLHTVTFAVAVAITVYVTMDIEYPRRGLVRVDAFDQALVAVRQGMK